MGSGQQCAQAATHQDVSPACPLRPLCPQPRPLPRPGPGGQWQPPCSEDILESPYSDTFSCEGQGYGYYADVQSGCQVFHICLPIEDNEGVVIETAKWSFFCGNGTVFDQETLTCNFPDAAFPCEESPSLYGAVEFGKIPDDY